MQKLCRETRVPICTSSTAEHAKIPLQQMLLDYFLPTFVTVAMRKPYL